MSPRILLLLGATILVCGCAGRATNPDGVSSAPPMSVKEFYEFCSALPTPGACVSDPICQPYRKELSHAPADLKSCLSLCRQTYDAMYVDNLTNGCGAILERAQDLCDQFCRRRDRS
ncbi:hypothetical protein [Solidesulfovibrio sp.]|uniref:hypothetical protein n=1 Tax=Solidesulfovibrio sp. TaxID=2910990 RepID=UPI0026275EC0|nr:hypothetical protein [Solidesulfovibrio sp.]